MGEIGMLRLCGWAALIMEWVLRFLVPVFLGLCGIVAAIDARYVVESPDTIEETDEQVVS